MLAALVIVAVASGCENPTAAVNGTVVDKNGKPVTGSIVFMPEDGKRREAIEGHIVDGRYDLPTVIPGPKRIEVMVTGARGSFSVTPSPKEAELKAGPQTIDITVSD